MKNLKKLVLLTLVGVMAITPLVGTSVEADTNIRQSAVNVEYKEAVKFKVTSDTAVFRSGPSIDSRNLGVLPKDCEFEIIETVGEWVKFNYNGKDGYVQDKQIDETNKEIRGSITVRHKEKYSNKVLLEETFENLELTKHTFSPITFDSHTADKLDSITVRLSSSSPNKTIEFEYMPNFNPDEISPINKGMFSWGKEPALLENRADTIKWLKKTQTNEIYQSSLARLTEAERIDFIKDMTAEGIKVYSLTGDPRYFNNLNDYIRKIDFVVNHNTKAPADAQYAGIIFDVEPWALGSENWTEEEFASVASQAYEYAKSKNVEFIMCLPFWLEEATSETIIKNSDKTVVMNYNISNPVKLIREEMAGAKKHNKPISSAAETQDTDPRTTYFNVGIDQLIKDWTGINLTYNYDGLEFSLHHLNSLKEFFAKHEK